MTRRYSCYNRSEYWDELVVQDGWTEDGRRRTRTIPFVMSRGCEYIKENKDDEACRGCIWNKGVGGT